MAQKRIKIDGELAQNVDQVVHKFSQIVLDEQSLQNNQPVLDVT